MGKNTGHLTDGLASTLAIFSDIPAEFSIRFNKPKRIRRLRVLERRGLLEKLRPYQKGYVAYQLTPSGMGSLDRWLTKRRDGLTHAE